MSHPRILILSAIDPFPPTQGDEVRLAGLVEGAEAVGDVTLAIWGRGLKPGKKPVPVLFFRMPRGRIYWGALKNLARRRPLPLGAYTRRFPDVRGDWDLVVAFQLKAWRWAVALHGDRRVLELTDSLGLLATLPELPKLKRWQLTGAAKEEKEAAGFFDSVWVSAERDRAFLRRNGVEARLVVNGPLRVRPLPEASDAKRLLFVGNLHYSPNRQGLRRFLKETWPALERDGYVLDVVGKGSERLRRIPGVRGHGVVQDVEPFYRQAAQVVVPVDWGTGSQSKVWEAVGYGRKVLGHGMAGSGQIGRDLREIQSLGDIFAEALRQALSDG